MKRTLLCIVLVTFHVIVCYAAIAQDIPSVPLTKLIDPKLINITGTWNYSSSASVVTGVCPPGGPASGTCTIIKSGDTYTLKILSGRVCKPASMCTFAGQLSGNVLTLSNTDTVDSERGAVTNALGLLVVSNEFIDGRSSSRYVHPQGYECQWSNTMTLDRKLKK
jgi:hypothetical protein